MFIFRPLVELKKFFPRTEEKQKKRENEEKLGENMRIKSNSTTKSWLKQSRKGGQKYGRNETESDQIEAEIGPVDH